MSKIITSFLFTLISVFIAAQNEADMYRFSKVDQYGSARFEAMGGAFGALGADLSSSQINPAGFGRYSSSTFGLTFAGSNKTIEADFQNTKSEAQRSRILLNGIGVVITQDISQKMRGDLYEQFGFGMNRIADFNDRIHYEGQQFESLLDVYCSQASGYYPEELVSYFGFTTSLAWETYAINFDDATLSYYPLLNSGDMYHKREILTKGGINEWYFSYSRNRLNRLYWGLNLGIRSVKYNENYTHSESLTDTSGTSLRSFDYSYALETRGTAANLKIGVIYLLSESFRLGLAIHSPSLGEMEDDWTATMTSTFSDTTRELAEELTPYGNYKYRITTPPRTIASLAYIFGTKGCINLDVEHIAYNLAKYRSTNDEAYVPYNYEFENELIKNAFKSAFHVRLGGEVVFNSMYFVRAGAGIWDNAFKNEQEIEISPQHSISFGFGYKNELFSIDLAYRMQNFHRNYYAFENSKAEIKTLQNLFILSGNINF